MYEQIYRTYRTRFDELSPEKQFHFASRLKLACEDVWAAKQIEKLRPTILAVDSATRLHSMRKLQPNVAQLNAANLRIPLFQVHPWLYSYELMLFYVLHESIHYDVDSSDEVSGALRIHDADIESLVADATILASLSTYLVNTYYLHTRLISKSESLIPIDIIRNALQTELPENDNAKLKVYLLTHCILGETLFYARAIPSDVSAYYQEIGALLAQLTESTWGNLSIDAKLEAGYCLTMLGIHSAVPEKALSSAQGAYSHTKGFITDERMPHKNSLEWAEHRNVLYLMLAHYLKQS